MKKEYISPIAVVRSIKIENAFCLNTSDNEGSGEQFAKDYDEDDDFDYWD